DLFLMIFSVSHVKVVFFRNPNNGNSGEPYSFYGVEHIGVYKKPSDFVVSPPPAMTPSNGLHCSLHLKVGKEYLLSG
ncbi:hypothetical protein Angca_001436, partial [Angiostrongylus cantonensis]